MQLTTPLRFIPADAIEGPAISADFRIAKFDLEWRGQRLNKMKLPDWTDVLTKAGSPEEAVDNDGRTEISDDDPGGQPGTIPEAECFIGPKVACHQYHG